MEILEPYIDAPEGMSLISDNKKYLSRIYHDGKQRIEASKDPYTRFLVKKSSDGKRILLQADNDAFCSLILRGGRGYLLLGSSKAEF